MNSLLKIVICIFFLVLTVCVHFQEKGPGPGEVAPGTLGMDDAGGPQPELGPPVSEII